MDTISANTTIYAKWTPVKNTSPIPIALEIDLSEANWNAILSAINTANKFVSRDLLDCTKSTESSGGGLRSTGDFDPLYDTSTGKAKSLILPCLLWLRGLLAPSVTSPRSRAYPARG